MQSSGRVDRRNFARVPSSIEQSCGDGASPVSQERERSISQQPLCEIFSERAGKYSSERIFQLPDDNSLAGWEVIVHSCREISEWR